MGFAVIDASTSVPVKYNPYGFTIMLSDFHVVESLFMFIDSVFILMQGRIANHEKTLLEQFSLLQTTLMLDLLARHLWQLLKS